MPTYATAADVSAYVPGLVIDDAAAFDRLIERAERDVDAILGPYPAQDATGLKLDRSRLYAHQASALARAVAAQVEYLLTVGLRAGVKAAPTKVSGPDFTAEYAGPGGTTPGLGPKVARELLPLRELIRPRGLRARP